MAEAAGSFPARRTSLRGSRALLLGKPARARRLPRRSPKGEDRRHESYIAIGPVTVAAERRGPLIRWLTPPSQVRILPGPPAFAPCGRFGSASPQRREGCRVVARRAKTGVHQARHPYPNRQRECVESAFSGSSTLPGRTSAPVVRDAILLRYASGEAAAPSTRREGFDFPTERQIASLISA